MIGSDSALRARMPRIDSKSASENSSVAVHLLQLRSFPLPNPAADAHPEESLRQPGGARCTTQWISGISIPIPNAFGRNQNVQVAIKKAGIDFFPRP